MPPTRRDAGDRGDRVLARRPADQDAAKLQAAIGLYIAAAGSISGSSKARRLGSTAADSSRKRLRVIPRTRRGTPKRWPVIEVATGPMLTNAEKLNAWMCASQGAASGRFSRNSKWRPR